VAGRREGLTGEHVQWVQGDSPVSAGTLLLNTWRGAKKGSRDCYDHCYKTRHVKWGQAESVVAVRVIDIKHACLYS
jgi:hypothetical protein